MRYGILFEVEILHDYFLNLASRVHEALDDGPRRAARRAYSVPGFLEVFPTARTQSILAGHRALVKATADGLRVGVRLDPEAPDDRPAVPPADDFRLAFGLRVKDPRFFNYTTLGADFYYFSNGSDNEQAGGRFLTAPVTAFDAARAYQAGEIRADDSGPTVDLFRAVRDTGPAAGPVADDWERIPPDTFDSTAIYVEDAVVLRANRIFRAATALPAGSDTSNPAEWSPIGVLANQYLSAADRRVLRPALFEFDLSTAALPRATVQLLRPGQATAVRELAYAAAAGNLEAVQVDLRGVAPGRYRLEVLDGAMATVAGLGEDLYLDPEAERQGWFGVIEITAGSDGMALLDGAGALRSPRYTLRLLNRASRWRYVFPAPQRTGAQTEVATENGAAADRFLITATPRPLTHFGTGVRLQADNPATAEVSEEVRLPEPETNRIRHQSSQWYSEIHLSNLPL